jgi:hypothetical protein
MDSTHFWISSRGSDQKQKNPIVKAMISASIMSHSGNRFAGSFFFTVRDPSLKAQETNGSRRTFWVLPRVARRPPASHETGKIAASR